MHAVKNALATSTWNTAVAAPMHAVAALKSAVGWLEWNPRRKPCVRSEKGGSLPFSLRHIRRC